jgi:hypothetical protein
MKRSVPLMLLSLVACGPAETLQSPLTAPDGAALNPVAWTTPTVSLTADDFWIIADGQRFIGNPAGLSLHSDPGDATYTTLELTWDERDVEMRLNIYFSAGPTGWWSPEVRTYDAQPDPNANWLYYDGTFFKSAIGAAYRGDVDLTTGTNVLSGGELHMHGLILSTTLAGQ